MTSEDKVKTVKTSKRATDTCELTWQANAGYITPWEAAEDISTLPGNHLPQDAVHTRADTHVITSHLRLTIISFTYHHIYDASSHL